MEVQAFWKDWPECQCLPHLGLQGWTVTLTCGLRSFPLVKWVISRVKGSDCDPFVFSAVHCSPMRNLRDNRRRCRRWDQNTSWRHFSSVDVAPRKRSCTFFSIPASWRFFIHITDEILRTLHLMHDGISFDKILPKQMGYFGAWINWNQRWKIENSVSPLAAPRRGLVLRVPHCSFSCLSKGN
jgi:hypothetical protein